MSKAYSFYMAYIALCFILLPKEEAEEESLTAMTKAFGDGRIPPNEYYELCKFRAAMIV